MNFMLPPKAQCYVNYLFCVIWAAAARRLRSLPIQVYFCLQEKGTQVVKFPRKVLKQYV
jgi:hypothetical protein